MNDFSMQLLPLRAFLYQIAAFLPRLLFAAVVLVGGWLIAKVVRFAVTKALRAINFPVLTEKAGLDGFLRQGGVRVDTTGLVGLLAYWAVILAALIIAFNSLGLTYITDLLGRVIWFVPNVFVALLVLAFGAYFARFVGDAVRTYGRNVGLPDATFFSRIAQYAILVFVILIALDHLRIGGDIVRESFLVILAGFVFALALAFGLAGKDWAARHIQQWLPPEVDGAPRAAPLGSATAPVAAATAAAAAHAAMDDAPVLDPAPDLPATTPPPPAPQVDGETLPRPASARGSDDPLIPRRPVDPPPPL
ncbi:Conserved TM helix [Pseudacidovorax sp. RU35E]|nr:Conserved TM helix [Pseudacidovorax sp. RU35E]